MGNIGQWVTKLKILNETWTTTTTLQPFYGSLDLDRIKPGEPVP